MSLSESSIRRPVMATVLSLVPVIFGLVAIFALGVREYPAVDPPIVTVNTFYQGASPEVIDAVITEPRLAIEFAGSYTPARVREFIRFCEVEGLPYAVF